MADRVLPSRDSFSDADIKTLYKHGFFDEEKIIMAYVSGRLLHREAIHPLLDAEFLGRAANGLTIAAEGKVWLDKKYCLEQAAVLYEAAAAIGGDEDVSASS